MTEHAIREVDINGVPNKHRSGEARATVLDIEVLKVNISCFLEFISFCSYLNTSCLIHAANDGSTS